jgi:PPOX class probable F420-dependent enzyme
MADPVMTEDERTAFLTDVRVGVLAIERPGKGPLAHPIWYVYDGTDVLITMEATSAKATLLRRAGRATMVVQDEAPPYRYVSVEGPVTIAPAQDGDGYDLREVAIRYLGARGRSAVRRRGGRIVRRGDGPPASRALAHRRLRQGSSSRLTATVPACRLLRSMCSQDIRVRRCRRR